MTCISKTRANSAKLMPDSESASLKTPKTILISPATKNFFDFVGQCYLRKTPGAYLPKAV